MQTAAQWRALWEAQRELVGEPLFDGIWEPYGALGVYKTRSAPAGSPVPEAASPVAARN